MGKKAIIYYFSGTGNSLFMAKRLAERLDAKLVPIPSAAKSNKLESAAAIGVVFPVYCWGMPSIVVDFAKKLAMDSYYFGIATYGGMVGNSLLQLDDVLRSNGQSLSAGFGIHLPGNYYPMYGARPIEKQKKLFDAAEAKIQRIIKILQQKRSGKLEKSNLFVNSIMGKFLYKKMMKNMKFADKNYKVDKTCSGCGICAKICPVGNISLKGKKPVWSHNCQQCMACLQWCPKKAIQFGKVSPERTRYHNPSIKIQEMLLR